MMMTAQEREAEYADSLGRCEVCGHIVDERDLIEVLEVLACTTPCADVVINEK